MPTSNVNRNKKIKFQGQGSKSNSVPSKGKAGKAGMRRKTSIKRRQKGPGGKAVKGAQNKLKKFQQGSILAVAVTGFLLILFTPGEAGYSQDTSSQEEITSESQGARESQTIREDLPDSVAIIENIAVEDLLAQEEDTISTSATQSPEDISKAAKDEALNALHRLWEGFYTNLPKILVAIITLIVAWLFVRLIRLVLRKTISHWHNSGGVTTLIVISIWLFAIGVAISVVAGDIRALIGSLGLVGLALSWSLQTPIESFTGWLLNSFRGYYRVGDRINVGDVFGDVYKIDFLTTTVWEIGGPYQNGFVQAEQPTGRLVTFPNNEILAGTVVNLTGDFPYVWDELSTSVANESDLHLAMEVMQKVAADLMGDYMQNPALQYQAILRKAGLEYSISDKPEVFIATRDSWTDVIIRYLVGARERRKWKTQLTLQLSKELGKEEYAGKIIGVYPRTQVQFIKPDGKPTEVNTMEKNSKNEYPKG